MHGYNASPVQALQEMFKERGAVRFAEEGRRGPPHNPEYRFSCTVFGDVFFGHGNSKQSAKQDAARNALQFIGGTRRRVHPYFPRAPYGRRDFLFYNRPPRPPPLLPNPHNLGFKRSLLPTPPCTYNTPLIESITVEPITNDFQTLLESNEPNSSSASNTIATQLNEFASDDLEVTSDFIKFDEVSKKSKETVTEKPIEIKKQKTKERIMLRIMSESSEPQNPVALIHELNPDCSWQFIKAETVGQLASSFTMQLTINESLFLGVGRTKKLAKMAAAKTALFELYNINLPNESTVPQSFILVEEPLLLDQNFANFIGNVVLSKSKEIFELSVNLKKWNVLASIVLTDESRPQWFDVICVTSGTKCVKGDNLSMLGQVVGDCHAEIIARRCFLLYLYRQINSFLDSGCEDKPEFIIESREDSRGYRLKESIKVNLFISTAPCGDSRVFSPKEETLTDNHPNRQSRGVLRAKIECGEGTIPVKKETSTLTWDGILQGHQRLQFMSCSDKICLWNVAGIQGSLLSHFIDPIYFNCVIVGSLFNYEHLVRAIHSRLNLNFESDSLNSLPQPFGINKPKVAKAVLKEIDDQRQLSKCPNYSVNWIKGDTKLEVINCETGKLQEGSASRLSKKFLFAQFCNLLGRNVSTLASSPLTSYIPVVYRDAKTSAHNYQKTKTCVIQAFVEQSLGTWIQVPTEIDLFNL